MTEPKHDLTDIIPDDWAERIARALGLPPEFVGGKPPENRLLPVRPSHSLPPDHPLEKLKRLELETARHELKKRRIVK